MGRYIDWADVMNRYPLLARSTDATEAASHHIAFAENYIDARLGSRFTIPFSSNNETARDLCIETVAARYYMGSKKDAYETGMKFVDDFIGELVSGVSVMVTTSGTAVYPDQLTGYSNTQAYRPVFGLDDYVFTDVDSSIIDVEREI